MLGWSEEEEGSLGEEGELNVEWSSQNQSISSIECII